MSTGTGPLRRRLDAQTRRATILAAARAAFGAQPYEQVSMARIAAEAGASEALLYRYHPSKAALFTEVATVIWGELQAERRARGELLPPGSGSRDVVRAALETELDLIASGQTRLLYTTGPEEAIRGLDRLHDEQAAWLTALPGTRLDEYAVRGYLGFVRAAIALWIARDCPAGDRERICQHALTALFGDPRASDWGRHGPRRSKFGRR